MRSSTTRKRPRSRIRAKSRCENHGNASGELPGTLKKVTIVTRVADGESKVVLEVLGAKLRHVLPGKIFDVE